MKEIIEIPLQANYSASWFNTICNHYTNVMESFQTSIAHIVATPFTYHYNDGLSTSEEESANGSNSHRQMPTSTSSSSSSSSSSAAFGAAVVDKDIFVFVPEFESVVVTKQVFTVGELPLQGAAFFTPELKKEGITLMLSLNQGTPIMHSVSISQKFPWTFF